MEYTVYLAGPITGLTWEQATGWRNDVTAQLKECDVTCYSPLRFKTFLSHLNGNGGAIPNITPKSPLSTQKGIMTRDRWDATRCDVLFVNFLGSTIASIGTIMEIAWAEYERIPVVIVMEEGNIHQHAMVKEAAGYIVDSLDTGVEIVRSLLTQG